MLQTWKVQLWTGHLGFVERRITLRAADDVIALLIARSERNGWRLDKVAKRHRYGLNGAHDLWAFRPNIQAFRYAEDKFAEPATGEQSSLTRSPVQLASACHPGGEPRPLLKIVVSCFGSCDFLCHLDATEQYLARTLTFGWRLAGAARDLRNDA